MPRTLSVSDSIVIAAEPQELYDRISDPTAMGSWSPENQGAVVDGHDAGSPTGTVVGTSFVGTNRRGRATWVTRCTVTAADPGRRFAFRVHRIGLRTPRLNASIASWEYRFEADPTGGTRVVEVWTDDRRWPDALAAVFDRIATGGSSFADFQRRNIASTLKRLKAVFEG